MDRHFLRFICGGPLKRLRSLHQGTRIVFRRVHCQFILAGQLSRLRHETERCRITDGRIRSRFRFDRLPGSRHLTASLRHLPGNALPLLQERKVHILCKVQLDAVLIELCGLHLGRSHGDDRYIYFCPRWRNLHPFAVSGDISLFLIPDLPPAGRHIPCIPSLPIGYLGILLVIIPRIPEYRRLIVFILLVKDRRCHAFHTVGRYSLIYIAGRVKQDPHFCPWSFDHRQAAVRIRRISAQDLQLVKVIVDLCHPGPGSFLQYHVCSVDRQHKRKRSNRFTESQPDIRP